MKLLATSLAVFVLMAAPAAAAPVVTEFDLPTAGAAPQDIVAGPDGNIWFTERGANKIGRVTPDGVITEFDALDGLTSPDWITVGPDGNLWYTGAKGGAGAVGRMPPGKPEDAKAFDGLGLANGARGIAVGPDKNLWIVEPTTKVLPLGVDGKPVVGKEVQIPTIDGRGITLGPDGNLWVAGFNTNNFGRITPAGVLTEFKAPGTTTPYDLVGGPDGNVWYAAQGTTVGRITPAGVPTNFVSKGVDPFGIALGPDGAVWYAEFQANAIGRVDMAGVTSNVTGLTPSKADPKIAAGPRYVTAGPGNTVWFTEETGNRVGRISGIDLPGAGGGGTPPPPPPPPADTRKPSITRLGLSKATFASGKGTVFRFTLSEAATVRFTIQRAKPGRRVNGKCVKPRRALRHRPRCTRGYTTLGSFARAGTAGRNAVTFDGRIARRKLGAGIYKVVMTASDAAGNRSAATRAPFTVVKPVKARKRG